MPSSTATVGSASISANSEKCVTSPKITLAPTSREVVTCTHDGGANAVS